MKRTKYCNKHLSLSLLFEIFVKIQITLSLLFIFGCQSAGFGLNNEINDNLDLEMSEYFVDSVPFESEKLPVIKITSSTGQENFVTKPVAYAVTEQKKTWNEYTYDPVPFFEDCTITVLDENQKICQNSEKAKVKVRGNWTSNYPKKPLKIKFEKKQSMLGLHENEKFNEWVLQASFKDWSFLRDETAYYINRMINPMYTTDCRLVKVYINEKYWGVYLLAEQQEINKSKINITKPENEYTGTDIGYLLELDCYSQYEDYNFNVVYSHPLLDMNKEKVTRLMNGYSIKSQINDEAQANFIGQYMNNLWKICDKAVYKKTYYKFNTDKTEIEPYEPESCYECISSIIDIESLVNMYVLQEICCDADIGWSSFYMTVDFGEGSDGKLRFDAPWDFDSALGNKNFCPDSNGVFAGKITWDVNHQFRDSGNPWFLMFINCDWFQDLIRQKWKQLQENKVHQKVLNHIAFVKEQYKEDFAENYERWPLDCSRIYVMNELSQAAGKCQNQNEAAEYLYTWLDKRFTSLDKIWGSEDN